MSAINKNSPEVSKIREELEKMPDVDYSKDIDYISDSIQSDFIEEILQEMKEQDITASDIAQRFNRSDNYVSNILNEKVKLNVDHLAMFAIALNREIEIRFI